MTARDPRVLLAYPPITDPTSPYHSLVYVASFARARGFRSIEIRDTNIEALRFLAEPAVMEEFLASWDVRYDALSTRASLCGREQIEYQHLLRAKLLRPESAREAIATLRDPERFYDYSQYHDAVRTLQVWLQSLSLDAFPGQFANGFDLTAVPASVSSIAELTDPSLLDRIVGPFRRYFDERFLPWLRERRFDVVGINVTYTSQLPYALWLAREVRSALPDAYLVCGGTEVSDVWKYALQRERLGELFAGVDACVVGEGESAFVELLETLRDGTRPAALTNAIVFDGDRTVTPPKRIAYENLDALPVPEYALLADAGYFAPEGFAYYSPTRGCYWNRCTFCDYGLNFGTPTSPWRQRSLDAVLEDLRAISQHARFVYFSVDVLAPASVTKLARAIADAGIDLRWAAEVRLERTWSADACAELRRSGCVAVSVGFESGSQRVLDAIDKGTKPAQIATTLRDFHHNRIAVQMMGFTGFPSETEAEALESVTFLSEHREHWNIAGLGRFVLTPGAIVATRPHDFGVLEHGPYADDDIARVLRFREVTPKSAEEEARVERAKRRLDVQHFDRPFAGGIDTPHSLMYFERFGAAFPRTMVAEFEATRSRVVWDRVLVPDGIIVDDVRFDPWALPDADLTERTRLSAGRDDGRQPRAADFAAAFDAEPKAVRTSEPMTYFVRSDGTTVPLSRELYRVLRGITAGRSLADVGAEERAVPGPDGHAVEIAAALLSVLAWARPAAALPQPA
ncbi:MAG: hypothetical protein NVS3B7_00850 [Candidatus Elarobacter sp.]